jgi:hypothetical protein
MKKYFYSNEQGELGPVTLEELKQKDITLKTLIWHEGLDDWKEAESIDELKEIFELLDDSGNWWKIKLDSSGTKTSTGFIYKSKVIKVSNSQSD